MTTEREKLCLNIIRNNPLADKNINTSVTYFTFTGFSIDEGGRFFNIHISWLHSWYWFYFYIYIGGKRWFKLFKKKEK